MTKPRCPRNVEWAGVAARVVLEVGAVPVDRMARVAADHAGPVAETEVLAVRVAMVPEGPAIGPQAVVVDLGLHQSH